MKLKWPVPLVDEAEISDPDDDGNVGVTYKAGPTTEMVPRRWNQTSVTVRRGENDNSLLTWKNQAPHAEQD